MSTLELARHEEDAAIGAALASHVLDYFCCRNGDDEAAISRRLYKDTDCGAWFKWTETGFTIGTIVEGSEATLAFAFTYHPNLDLEDEEERKVIHHWLDHHIEQLEIFADEEWARS